MNGRSMSRVVVLVSLGLLMSGGPAAAQATPQQAPTVKREAAQSFAVDGGELYQDYCAVCHGKEATGNGPAASALKVPASDLTTLARRNEGKFDRLAVQNIIAGQNRLMAAHGSKDMPIWGPVFRDISHDDTMAALRVRNLVRYLESLQVK